MQEGFININGIPSHVHCWGRWLQLPFPETLKEVVIVIPGNPGVPDLYTETLGHLDEHLEGKIPIWCIDHLGHSILPKENSPHEKLFGLDDQLKHKVISEGIYYLTHPNDPFPTRRLTLSKSTSLQE